MIQNNLLVFSNFSGKKTPFGRGTFRHAGEVRVISRACSQVTRAAKDEDFYSQFMESGSLFMNLIGNRAMSAWAMDDDIDRASVFCGHCLMSS
ncbi:MAG: hypothetical protein WCG66_01640 [bacterium]